MRFGNVPLIKSSSNSQMQFVLETIMMNESTSSPPRNQPQDSRQRAQTSVENYPLSPIEESNQHGGMIAGARSEHGQRFRGIGSMPEQQQQQQQQSPTRREQQQLPTSRVNNSTTPWASMDPPPKPHAPSSTSGGQTWQISFPTASGNQVRTSNENFIPPQPAPPQYDPNSPSRYQTNNSMFLEEPLRNSSEIVDTKARNIYGGTMGGGVSSPTKNPLSNSMPNGPSAWGNQGQVNPGNYTLPPQPSR